MYIYIYIYGKYMVWYIGIYLGIYYDISIYLSTYGIHHWSIFELAIESWPEWDLNPRPLNSVQTPNRLSYQTRARFRFKQMWQLTKTMAEMKCKHWTKRWNWSSCTKVALTASWTHGLIAQRNSVVLGSNPTQANFL